MTYQITDPTSQSTFSATGAQATQTTVEVQNVTGSANQNATLSLSASNWVAFRFNSGAGATSETWATATAWMTAAGNASDTQQLDIEIRADSAGLPGTFMLSAGVIAGNGIPTSGTPNPIEVADLAGVFNPANSTYYWLVLHFGSAPAGTYTVAYDNSTGSGLVATSTNSGSTWGAISGTGYFQLGQGTSHGIIVNSSTGHAIDATTITGVAVYGKSTGAKGTGGYFVAGPMGYGIWIDASNAANAAALNIAGANGQILSVDPNAQLIAPGLATNRRTVTANYTCTKADSTIFVNASSKTVTLPAPSTVPTGRMYRIKNLNGVTGTIVTATSGNVDNAVSDTTTLASALGRGTWQSDGTDWWSV